MKKARFYRLREDRNINEEVKISSYGRTRKVSTLSSDSILFIKSDKETYYTIDDIPYEISHKLMDLNIIYSLFEGLGLDNISELRIIPPIGPFIEVTESNEYNIKSIFKNRRYPIASVKFEIENTKGDFNFYKDNKLLYNAGFPIESNIKNIQSK